MTAELKTLLEILDGSLDYNKQQKIEEKYVKVLNWEPVEKIPLLITFPYPDSAYLQPFPHREVFDDPEKMLFNELVHAFDTSILLHSKINDDLPFTIRANFGTVIIASLFGGQIEQRGDNPPWVRHFKTRDEFKTVFDKDPLDFSRGFCSRVIDVYKYYRDILADYPNLQKCIKIVLPDLQGPIDSLELLRGSSIYEDLILEPEMVDKGLQLMALAQVGFAKYLQQFITDRQDSYSHQHAITIKGNILIRNDSAIMISPQMYSEQIASHDEYVLKQMGGGGIHSCGKIEYNIPEMFNLPSIQCFDFGQSHLNNIDFIYSLAEQRKIPLVRIRVGSDELLSGKVKERFPTGVSLIYDASSFEDARSVAKSYEDL